jgi:hypothetical protein
LVDGKVHLTALVGFAILDLPAGITKGSKYLVLGIVNQDIAVGKIEDLGAAVFTGGVPTGAPEFPTNLKGDNGLAGAGGHSEQNPLLPLHNGLHNSVNGDFLIIAGTLAAVVVVRGEKLLTGGFGDVLLLLKSLPQFRRCREVRKYPFLAGQVVEFDDLDAIGSVGELEPQNFGILFGLLQTVTGGQVIRFCLDNSNEIIAGIILGTILNIQRLAYGLLSQTL